MILKILAKIAMDRENVLTRLKEINQSVTSGNISQDDGFEALKELDFTYLSFDDMEQFEEMDWIPDDFYVDTIRKFIEKQDENIKRIKAFLFVNSTISKQMLLEFIDSIFIPSQTLCCEAENLFHLLGTAGNSRPYTNPTISSDGIPILSVSCEQEMILVKKKLFNAFDEDSSTCFCSNSTKPNVTILIDLPEFLQVSITSYSITGPVDGASPRSWVIMGSTDKKNWFEITNVVGSNELVEPSSEAKFVVSNPSPYCTYIQFKQTEPNNKKNNSLSIAKFDISGNIRLVR